MSYIKVNANGFVTNLSEVISEGRIEVTLTTDQEANIFNGKYIWDGEELVLNPDWEEPINQELIEDRKAKREFGQNLLAEIEVELQVEQIMENNPQQGLLLQESLGDIIQSLNNGYLNAALKQIEEIEPNQIITQAIIDKYVAKISSY